ncbi:MAG: hypothetical protein ACRD6W_00870 [Nitrososphaerales archaeon]
MSQKMVYVQDFGNYHKGDVVDIPDGARAPSQFLVPVKPKAKPAGPDAAKLAADAKVKLLQEQLAAAEAADTATK